jgi:hypothetical protein
MEPTPPSLTLNPSEVEAGGTAEGTVTLSGPAPPGGVAVSLSSSKPKVARVEPSVTIEEGKRSGTFTVSTSAESASSISTLPISHYGKYLLVAASSKDNCPYGDYSPTHYDDTCGTPPPETTDICQNGDYSGNYYDGICGESSQQTTDNCPNGDYSGDYYDGICGEPSQQTTDNCQNGDYSGDYYDGTCGQGPYETTQEPGPGPDETTQERKEESRKQPVEVTITASLKGVARSATLTVQRIQ